MPTIVFPAGAKVMYTGISKPHADLFHGQLYTVESMCNYCTNCGYFQDIHGWNYRMADFDLMYVLPKMERVTACLP